MVVCLLFAKKKKTTWMSECQPIWFLNVVVSLVYHRDAILNLFYP